MDASPIGDRRFGRLVTEQLGGPYHGFGKGARDRLLGVTVVLEIVDQGVGRVVADAVLSRPQVRGPDRDERRVAHHHSLAGERSEDRGHDVDGHPHQTRCLVVSRERSVFVLVQTAQIDLADTFQRRVPVDLRQRPDLEAPVARHPIGTSEVS